MVQEIYTNEYQKGHLFRKQYTETKAQVPISTYCRDTGITELKRAGERLVGLCPFHNEKTPSFTVFGDAAYYCFGCAEQGDVIDLHRFAEGHDQAWMAMRSLAERYNVELPQLPERAKKWSCQKSQRRKKIRDALISSYQRRFFRVFGGHLEEIENPAERKAESAKFYEDLYPVAFLATQQRMEGWDA